MWYLTKDALRAFVNELIEHAPVPVYSPVQNEDGVTNFTPIECAAQADFDHVRTSLPPLRYYFLPAYEPAKPTIGSTPANDFVVPIKVGGAIFVGVHPYDIASLAKLDEVNGKKQLYRFRRRNLLLIGMMPKSPTPHSFCDAMGAESVSEGYDLMLHRLGDDYVVEVGTEWGEEVLGAYAITHTATNTEVETVQQSRGTHNSPLNPKSIATGLQQIDARPFFERMAELCLGCGVCTTVCPTCTCFSEQARLSLGGEGERWNTPGGCHEVEFSRAAGDHNIRPERADRYGNWIRCKLMCTKEVYGVPGCTGCGRCIDACPVTCENGNSNKGIANPLAAYRELMKETYDA